MRPRPRRRLELEEAEKDGGKRRALRCELRDGSKGREEEGVDGGACKKKIAMEMAKKKVRFCVGEGVSPYLLNDSFIGSHGNRRVDYRLH